MNDFDIFVSLKAVIPFIFFLLIPTLFSFFGGKLRFPLQKLEGKEKKN